MIGDIGYTRISHALAAIETGESKTIKLLDNITQNSHIDIDNKTVTLDLNGYTLNLNVSVPDFSEALSVSNGGKLLIADPQNGEFNVRTNNDKSAVSVSGNGSAAELTSAAASPQSPSYPATGTRGVYVDDGGAATVYGNVSGVVGLYITNSGKITVYGDVSGSSYGMQTSGAGAKEVYISGNISGGNISVYVVSNGGEVTVDGAIANGRNAPIYLGSVPKSYEDGVESLSKPGYLEFTDGENTVWMLGDWKTPPVISGRPILTLNTGYANTYTSMYSLFGSPAPIVTKISGDEKITWDSYNRCLNISAGLSAGIYEVALRAENEAGSYDYLITLTVVNGNGGIDDNGFPVWDSNIPIKPFTATGESGESLNVTISDISRLLDQTLGNNKHRSKPSVPCSDDSVCALRRRP